MKITVNGIEIATITTNRSLTLEEAMYAAGWDINDENDCEKGYNDGVEGFYRDDNGVCCFDFEAARMVY